MKSDALNPQFNQRGRAEIDFLINMFKGSARIRQEANAELSEAVGDVTTLPDDLDERNDVISTTLSRGHALPRTKPDRRMAFAQPCPYLRTRL